MLAIAALEGRRPDLAVAELLGRDLCALSSGDTGPDRWAPQFNAKAQFSWIIEERSKLFFRAIDTPGVDEPSARSSPTTLSPQGAKD